MYALVIFVSVKHVRVHVTFAELRSAKVYLTQSVIQESNAEPCITILFLSMTLSCFLTSNQSPHRYDLKFAWGHDWKQQPAALQTYSVT